MWPSLSKTFWIVPFRAVYVTLESREKLQNDFEMLFLVSGTQYVGLEARKHMFTGLFVTWDDTELYVSITGSLYVY